MKIIIVILLLSIYIVSIWISYIGGLTKGYKNLMLKDQTNWSKIDAGVYEFISSKKLKDIDPVVSTLAEIRLKEFKDKMKIEKRKKATKKISKKLTNKSSKKVKK
jgi:hypothetical protein